MARSFILVLWLSVLVGCGASQRVLLDDSARGSLSTVKIATLTGGKSVKDERSPEIRADVLRAIKGFMTRVGRYPQRSVEDAAIVILQPLDVKDGLSGGVFAYRALVRVDRAFAASQLVEFEVFDRSGKIVVKKVSL